MYRIYADGVAKRLNLGHKGENEARCIVFDLSTQKAEFGDGAFEIVHQRKGDAQPYLATNTREIDNNAVWVLTNVDTDIVGEGRCELRYKVNDVLCKTDVYATRVLPALGDTGEAPSPAEDLIDKMSEIKEATEASAKSATASSLSASASAESAKLSESNASASATQAASSATEASSYVNQAAESATQAKASASTATEASTSAKSSATTAATAATEAKASETKATEAATEAAKIATQSIYIADDGSFYALVEEG